VIYGTVIVIDSIEEAWIQSSLYEVLFCPVFSTLGFETLCISSIIKVVITSASVCVALHFTCDATD
jgi:hypothetical protein